MEQESDFASLTACADFTPAQTLQNWEVSRPKSKRCGRSVGPARCQLLEDIPRLVAETGDAIPVGGFYQSIYNATPAHTDDVHQAIIDNPDLEVLTPGGAERRKANTITAEDVLRLKRQTSFFPMFLWASAAGTLR